MDTMWEKVNTSFWVNLTAQFLEKLQTVENLAYFPQYRISYSIHFAISPLLGIPSPMCARADGPYPLLYNLIHLHPTPILYSIGSGSSCHNNNNNNNTVSAAKCQPL